ncbi:MAG: nucleotidyltransferase domain-containing protein [Deltaproteobacteria bacterium]|nr:nucleotidyltransferase domain-containing protein [Deltaproteobacteria bacterium]
MHQREEIDDQRVAEKVSGAKRAAVHQALTRLSEFGIIERVRRGRRCHNTIKFSQAWVLPLKIASNLLELQPIIDELKPIATKIVLFGSRAHGTNDETSDFDLAVIASDKITVERIVHAHALAEHIQLILKNEGEMLELKDREPVFFKQIKEGIIVWEQ